MTANKVWNNIDIHFSDGAMLVTLPARNGVIGGPSVTLRLDPDNFNITVFDESSNVVKTLMVDYDDLYPNPQDDPAWPWNPKLEAEHE